MLNKQFNSGKHKGKTYLQVWNTDRSYFYWMAENIGDYWKEVVRVFEQREVQIKTHEISTKVFPSVEKVRETFKLNPILGFDMSEYICEIYNMTPDSEKYEYYQSLLIRNNIK